MDWPKLIFVFAIIKPLGGIQNEINEYVGETIPGNYWNRVNISHSCPNQWDFQIFACRNEDKLLLKLKTNPYNKMLTVQSQGVNCFKFTQRDEIFTANYTDSVNSSYCNYYLHENERPLYFLDDDLRNISSECPAEKEICLASTCPLKNFNVYAKKSETFINLHLSWDEIDAIATIKLLQLNIRKSCYREHLEINYELKNNKLIIPNMPTKDEVMPGCRYDIFITYPNVHSKEKIMCKYNYTVPECVEDVCDCDYFAPEPSILGVEHILGNSFLVKWDPGKYSMYNKSYTIRRVEFIYFNTNEMGITAGKSAFPIKEDFENYVSEVEMKLFDGENYTLQAIFLNNVSCPNVRLFTFTAPTPYNYTLCIILSIIIILVIISIAFERKRVTNSLKTVLNFELPSRRRTAGYQFTPLINLQIHKCTSIKEKTTKYSNL